MCSHVKCIIDNTTSIQMMYTANMWDDDINDKHVEFHKMQPSELFPWIYDFILIGGGGAAPLRRTVVPGVSGVMTLFGLLKPATGDGLETGGGVEANRGSSSSPLIPVTGVVSWLELVVDCGCDCVTCKKILTNNPWQNSNPTSDPV